MRDPSSEREMTHGISVVIPAHNEEAVLPATLGALLDQDFDERIDIVVVANGCSDSTVTLARSFIPQAEARGHSLLVCETDEAGKPNALNRGDELKSFPTTMYLDADVVPSTNAIGIVYSSLHASATALMVSPALEVAPSRSRVTRAYGRVWRRIPYISKRVRGVGCYAVNARGRARWGRYPDLLADDRFARLHFEAAEQQLLEEATHIWPLPEGTRELVRVRTRWLLGNDELRRERQDLLRNEDPRYEGLVRFVATHPWLWPDVMVFLGVYGLAWARMLLKRRRGDRSWERATRARSIRLSTTSAIES